MKNSTNYISFRTSATQADSKQDEDNEEKSSIDTSNQINHVLVHLQSVIVCNLYCIDKNS